MSASFSSPIPPTGPYVAVFVPKGNLKQILDFAHENDIDTTASYHTREEIFGTKKEAQVSPVREEQDLEEGLFQLTQPPTLTTLFAEKVSTAFGVGHRTLHMLLDHSLSISAIFAAVKALEASQPLIASVAKKLPERVTSLAARIPGIPVTNLLKFLGLFLLVEAAIGPCLAKISQYSYSPSDNQKFILRLKTISGLMTFMATQKLGWNINVATGVVGVVASPMFEYFSERMSRNYGGKLETLTESKFYKRLFEKSEETVSTRHQPARVERHVHEEPSD